MRFYNNRNRNVLYLFCTDLQQSKKIIEIEKSTIEKSTTPLKFDFVNKKLILINYFFQFFVPFN